MWTPAVCPHWAQLSALSSSPRLCSNPAPGPAARPAACLDLTTALVSGRTSPDPRGLRPPPASCSCGAQEASDSSRRPAGPSPLSAPNLWQALLPLSGHQTHPGPQAACPVSPTRVSDPCPTSAALRACLPSPSADRARCPGSWSLCVCPEAVLTAPVPARRPSTASWCRRRLEHPGFVHSRPLWR